MSTNIKIRPVIQDDFAQWSRLWTAYLAFYETSRPPEIFETTFARLLDPSDQEFSCLIGEIDGVPKGLTHFLYHRHCWNIENVCYLQDLFVDPDTRGTGLGRALIEAVYADADTKGCPSVYWITQEGNQTARVLYDRIASLTPFVRYSR